MEAPCYLLMPWVGVPPLVEPFAGSDGAEDIFTRPAGGWTGQIGSELRRRVEHPGLWGGPVDV